MKPHIVLIDRMWWCGLLTDSAKYWGMGYTPESAYDDWKRQQ